MRQNGANHIANYGIRNDALSRVPLQTKVIFCVVLTNKIYLGDLMANRKNVRSFFLLERRQEAGFKSARQFSEEMGLNERTYSAYEQCRRTPDLALAVKIAKRLHCTVEDFFVETRDDSSASSAVERDPIKDELLEHYEVLNLEARGRLLDLARAADESAGPDRFSGLPALAAYWQALADKMKAEGPTVASSGRSEVGADSAISA